MPHLQKENFPTSSTIQNIPENLEILRNIKPRA